MSKRLLYTKPRGKRKVGRPRTRWLDEVNSDARETGIRRWWPRVLDKGEWRRLLKEAKTLKRIVVLMTMIY
jgi:hypothetical protein